MAAFEFGRRSSADEVLAGRDLSGRTMIVTGANTGIGFETARALAAAGARVILACRSAEAGRGAVDRVLAAHPGCAAEFARLDLASFASIHAFARDLDAERIDVLICNAGLTVPDYRETAEGFELTVGVCHVGHFLLTRYLLPRLLASDDPRVVMVSSESHRMPRKLDFDRLPLSREQFRPLLAYGQAKQCNVLMARGLQQRFGGLGLTACSLHPGTLVTTDIGRNSMLFRVLMALVSPLTKNPAQGAATSVVAAVHEPAADLAGVYLSDCRPVASTAESADPATIDRLWALSEQWTAAAPDLPAWPGAAP